MSGGNTWSARHKGKWYILHFFLDIVGGVRGRVWG